VLINPPKSPHAWGRPQLGNGTVGVELRSSPSAPPPWTTPPRRTSAPWPPAVDAGRNPRLFAADL